MNDPELYSNDYVVDATTPEPPSKIEDFTLDLDWYAVADGNSYRYDAPWAIRTIYIQNESNVTYTLALDNGRSISIPPGKFSTLFPTGGGRGITAQSQTIGLGGLTILPSPRRSTFGYGGSLDSGGGSGGNVTIIGPFGQATMAASVPVSIANNQSAVPVSLAAQPNPVGANNFAANSTALSTVAASIAAARATRTGITIFNRDTAITIYVGGSNVTNGGTNGVAILPGQSRTFTAVTQIYAVAASGTPTIDVWDEFN